MAFLGLLTLAQDVPFIGPVAGILSGFFDRYQTLSSNKENFKDLKEEFEKMAALIREEGLKNLMMNSQPDSLLATHFKQFNKRVFEIQSLMNSIEDRIQSKALVANAKNFIMADKDKERVQVALIKSKETRTEIFGMLAAKKILDKMVLWACCQS